MERKIGFSRSSTLLAFLLLVSGIWLAACITTPQAKYPQGMISYWTLEDTTGSKVPDVVDGNNGNLMTAVVPVGGIVGKGIDLGGVNYIMLTTNDSLRPFKAVTLEAWVKVRDNSTDQHIISTGGDGPSPFGHDYYIRIDQGAFEFRINDDPLRSDFVVPLQSWFHVAATYDSLQGVRRIFLNGSLLCENNYSGPINTAHTYTTIGINARVPAFGDNFQPLNGILDEVAIYNVALSPSEIFRHYSNGQQGKGYHE